MIPLVVTMLLLAWWERPNLRLWGAGERWAFWVFWGLALLWALTDQTRVALPSMTALTDRLFAPWARALLRPRPNIYW